MTTTNEPAALQQLFAFVSVDPDHNVETVIGMRDVGQHWQPLIGEDVDRVELLKPIAKRIAHDTGREVKLIRFTTREELPL